MPEGPSIVILKEKVAHLKNKIVSEASGYAELDMDAITHKKIIDFKSWGKHFLICFTDFTIRIHFGLFGSYQLHEPKKVNPKIALHFNDDTVYFYVCTVKQLNTPLDEIYDWEADVMGNQWKPAKALKKLRANESTMISDVLLDQQIFSGVGNIIKNEVLYRCRVHPESLVKNIPDAKLKAIVRECRNYSFDFLKWKQNNELSRHFEVYEQKTNRKSGKTVIRKNTGKTKRSSYYIEKVQRLYG
ncbi:MAG TPA: DNA-formamidopyrimidine glycosylase family protein [Pedobacter sp.]|nr:DNA-formamidopyrimidine glycosylase family protein [Pedobacter sp.]